MEFEKQLYAQEHIKEYGGILFAKDISPTKNTKRYIVFESYTDSRINILNIFNENINTHYYEIIPENVPVKLFLDIDCNLNKTKYTNIDDILNDVLQFFEPILNNYGYNNYPVIVLNATTHIKFSLHILFPTVIFKSISIMKHFINSIDNDLIGNIIDKSVYRVGCFRLLRQYDI